MVCGRHQIGFMRFQKVKDRRLRRGFSHGASQSVRGQAGKVKHPSGAVTVSQHPPQRLERERGSIGLNLPRAFRICFDHGFGLSESRGAA